MCRLLAYHGPATTLASVIIDQPHSLLRQSQHSNEAKVAVQGDGFGVAWYDEGRGPGLFRDVTPAWSDGNLPSLCRMVRSDLFLAHVRASTAGETSRLNCHPFAHGRWSFMHNGQVPDIARVRRRLEEMLPDDLYEARRGTTDSELIFLLLLTHGLDTDATDAEGAIRAVIALLRDVCAWGRGVDAVRLACVMSDGARLIAFRLSSDAKSPTLYETKDAETGAITLASEPLDGRPERWTLVPEATILTLGRERTTVRIETAERPMAA